MMGAVVQASDVVKAYGDLMAVRGISFSVRFSECFGFLGPNGAGKSSLLRMIGCVSPSPRATCGSMAFRSANTPARSRPP